MPNNKKIKPNLFIVGAAKAGTTSIYHYLNKHPDIYMSPIKEPHYFSKDIRCENFTQDECMNVCFDIEKYLSKSKLEEKHIAFIDDYKQYLQLFREVKEEKYLAEISNGYLFSDIAAQEIYDFNPNAKIIIILRNPVERAYSHWKMDKSAGKSKSNLSPFDAINLDFESEVKGFFNSHLYIELGYYYKQIKRFSSLFPKKNIQILSFDDLSKDTDRFMEKIYSFLELESISHLNDKQKNISIAYKYNWLRKVNVNNRISKYLSSNIKDILRQYLGTKNFLKMSTGEKYFLYTKYFKEDILNLEKLLNQNLDSWKYEEN